MPNCQVDYFKIILDFTLFRVYNYNMKDNITILSKPNPNYPNRNTLDGIHPFIIEATAPNGYVMRKYVMDEKQGLREAYEYYNQFSS